MTLCTAEVLWCTGTQARVSLNPVNESFYICCSQNFICRSILWFILCTDEQKKTNYRNFIYRAVATIEETIIFCIESWSHDVTSMLTSVPLASRTQCNFSCISFLCHFEKWQVLPGFAFHILRQITIRYCTVSYCKTLKTFVVLTRLKRFVSTEKKLMIKLEAWQHYNFKLV